MQNAEVRSAVREIVVAGGGFAGLWASLAAVRELECAGATAGVSLVSADPYLVVRPRLYEPDPVQMRELLTIIDEECDGRCHSTGLCWLPAALSRGLR